MATINEITQGSQYTGNAALGGGNFGVGQLDTKPIEDLARYTFLYNKAEYDQRQKDAEKAAAEIAALVKYDLKSGIPKDAKLLQDEFDGLMDYLNKNPGALDYNNKEAWAAWNKKLSKIENDIAAGKVRSIINTIREKNIADEKDPKLKALMRQELDDEIAKTDIRTPLNHDQQYDDSMPAMPDVSDLKFDVMQKGPNQIYDREHVMLNMGAARAKSKVFGLGMNEVIDESTPEGKRKAIARKNNFWLDGAEKFNEMLASYKDANGNIDESKMKGVAKDIYGLVKETNEYMAEKRNEIKAGIYKDKLVDKVINFGPGALKEEDYQPINIEDGFSPDELALVQIYAKWKGDDYNTKAIQTNDQIEMDRIAATKRGQDLDYKVAWKNAETARINANKPSGSGADPATSKIQTPAILFGEHINRLKNKFASMPANQDLLVLDYKALDEKTRTALGLTDEDGYVTYMRDGSYRVGTDKNGKGGAPGTIEQFKQALINVTKAGMSAEGVQSEGFQDESEKGFDNIFGTRSGSAIWSGWDKKPAPAKTESDGTQKKRVYKGLDAKGNPIYE